HSIRRFEPFGRLSRSSQNDQIRRPSNRTSRITSSAELSVSPASWTDRTLTGIPPLLCRRRGDERVGAAQVVVEVDLDHLELRDVDRLAEPGGPVGSPLGAPTT